jgi:hypothetical protein
MRLHPEYAKVKAAQEALINRKNEKAAEQNGIYDR